MNILVLNGSPKGKNSVTLQTSLFWQKKFPEHEFEFLNAASRIKAFEKDFSTAKLALEKAELVIFSYPVYTFLAPYQLHRFIELMKENDVSLKGKFATQISTSKHFFDITAHKYIEENCYDLDAKYIVGLSADMEDLLESKGREQAVNFFEKLIFDIDNDIYLTISNKKEKTKKPVYQTSLKEVEKTGKKDVLIVTNVADEDINLKNMIADFKASSKNPVREINIRKFKFSGGCLGCMNCSTTAKCIYKDGFDDYLRNEIQNSDSIVYAYTIENHYTHSSFKCYDDRQFCNGHRSVTHGMSVAYIISGDYQNEPNVQTLVRGRSDVGGVYLAGVATDEFDTASEIKKLALSLEYCLENEMDKPETFYGVGGTKIFRDLVYLMQGMMKADHKYYKKNGIYDFPQKKKMKIMQMKLIGSLMSNQAVRKKMKGSMSDFILMPYTKIIEEANENK
ncbi:MAG: iron-sulfur protein [Clostridia bacterium]